MNRTTGEKKNNVFLLYKTASGYNYSALNTGIMNNFHRICRQNWGEKPINGDWCYEAAGLSS